MDNVRRIRKPIYLEPEQNREIIKLSARKGETKAEIIMQDIDNNLLTNNKEQEDPILELITMVKKNIIDGSTSYDEAIYLAENGDTYEK